MGFYRGFGLSWITILNNVRDSSPSGHICKVCLVECNELDRLRILDTLLFMFVTSLLRTDPSLNTTRIIIDESHFANLLNAITVLYVHVDDHSLINYYPQVDLELEILDYLNEDNVMEPKSFLGLLVCLFKRSLDQYPESTQMAFFQLVCILYSKYPPSEDSASYPIIDLLKISLISQPSLVGESIRLIRILFEKTIMRGRASFSEELLRLNECITNNLGSYDPIYFYDIWAFQRSFIDSRSNSISHVRELWQSVASSLMICYIHDQVDTSRIYWQYVSNILSFTLSKTEVKGDGKDKVSNPWNQLLDDLIVDLCVQLDNNAMDLSSASMAIVSDFFKSRVPMLFVKGIVLAIEREKRMLPVLVSYLASSMDTDISDHIMRVYRMFRSDSSKVYHISHLYTHSLID